MNVLFFFLGILIALPLTVAASEKNHCGNIKIKKLSNNKIFVKFKGDQPFVKRLPHGIAGWNSSKSGLWIVFYGGYSPSNWKIGDQPLSMISIFRRTRTYKLEKKLIINKGVYEVKFDSADDIYISEPFGTLKISKKTLKKENLGMLFDIDSKKYDSCEKLNP